MPTREEYVPVMAQVVPITMINAQNALWKIVAFIPAIFKKHAAGKTKHTIMLSNEPIKDIT